MNKKKTTFTWIVFSFTILAFMFTSYLVILTLLDFQDFFFLATFADIVPLILALVELVILSIFVFKLYNVSLDLFKWTHIVFGYFVFEIILYAFLEFYWFRELTSFADKGFSVIVLMFIYVAFVKHLELAKKKKLMNFS